MTKRIFRAVFLASVGVFLASVVLFMTVLYDYFSAVQFDQLRIQTELASQGVANEGSEYFNGLEYPDYRITWIGGDGSVLYDSVSDSDSMENHFEREEIKEAFSAGYGESSRYSSTLTERYLYSAKRLSDGTVVRLSVAQKSMLTLTLGMLQPICVIFAAAIALSAFLAYRLSKKIVKPLNDLNLNEPLENEEYEELTPLFRRIDTQQKQIKSQKNELERKQSEFEAVTGGMAEGIILLNKKGVILSINRAAAKILGTDSLVIGEDILSVSQCSELAELLHKAENGEHSESVTEFGNGRYQIDASPIISNGEPIGTAVLLFDVTEKEKTEKMRREFSANVSHELKTPLHTISGCAELLSNGMVKAEDVADFSKQIYTEAKRMINLVDDIIKLSRLDESGDDMRRKNTDLFSVADSVVKTLAAEAKNAEISIELKGENVFIQGIPQLLESIIYNLCDNAIKYNRRGGSVSVTVKKDKDFAELSVADTGIGIPEEHLERIFERFYRVDKSHSKAIGGTGLGLSIVKHAARLHGAEIDIKSVVNTGTEVTVRFPANRE